jgi:hypothetical protein
MNSLECIDIQNFSETIININEGIEKDIFHKNS